jgi:hypothetical protein
MVLSQLAAFVGTGGYVCETTLSSRNAMAFSQFTVGPGIRQGIAPILPRPLVQHLPLVLASVNSEDAPNARAGWLLQMLGAP